MGKNEKYVHIYIFIWPESLYIKQSLTTLINQLYFSSGKKLKIVLVLLFAISKLNIPTMSQNSVCMNTSSMTSTCSFIFKPESLVIFEFYPKHVFNFETEMKTDHIGSWYSVFLLLILPKYPRKICI